MIWEEIQYHEFIREHKAQDSVRPYVINNRGHEWMLKENGLIDIFGYTAAAGWCNGPVCVKCGYGFCHHHHSEPQEDCK
jgi:hypothetical protein